jgi:preprotein translocase subunit SecA
MLTIATNMAGRGTDIALEPAVRDCGGLHVIIGEANDFGRIDRQLIGRCARQGDPGSVQRFVSFDEDLMRRFLPLWLRQTWLWLHARRPDWDQRMVLFVLKYAQWKAERLAFRQRQNILKQDVALERSGF